MPFIAEIVVKTAAPYLYLPRSINAFYPPDEFRRIITGCGFSRVTINSLTMGVATIYRAAKNG
jgi:ubiquinone/menaquinone biosynthesis C-methylase UbiE